jgi:hypothetical protein
MTLPTKLAECRAGVDQWPDLPEWVLITRYRDLLAEVDRLRAREAELVKALELIGSCLCHLGSCEGRAKKCIVCIARAVLALTPEKKP